MMNSSSSVALESVDHGTHTVIAPDLTLKNTALQPGSSRDVEAMLARADAALEDIKAEFGQWMDNELELVHALLEAYVASPSEEAKTLLYRALHNVRGNASTFGHMLAGRIADNMCKLFDHTSRVPTDIVIAHVQAIQAVVREKVTDLDHPVGGQLMEELQRAARTLMQNQIEAAEKEA